MTTTPVTVPTYADGTRLSIQLFTVEGSGCGPYVALPLSSAWTPYSAHLFTRATAEMIVRNLENDGRGIFGTFADDGTLTLTWTEDYDGEGGTQKVTPDAHGRYEIGGLWGWDDWGYHVPHTEWQAALVQGAAEYRQADASASLPLPLNALYSWGREEAHRVTLGLERS
ncbi:hypothetical protein AB0I69_42715 [Streptomyces sp. NPDC050508]|uniref:hypothetical protein n=1 Tax=Streptomyces sp. NPDC050508 TaxID=3155405 RepID=UPI00341F9FF9